MSVFSPNNLTLSPVQVIDIQDVILTKVFKKPTAQSLFTIVPNIKAGKDIGFLGTLGVIGKTMTGCDPTPNPNNAVATTKKTWNPKLIGDRLAYCWSDLLDTFFIWASKNGIEKNDLINTDFANFIEERVADAVWEMILRKTYFDNTNMNNASGGGYLGNAFDKTYFNSIVGLWPQLFTDGVANPKRVIRIAKDLGTTFAAQKFDDTDTTNQVATKIFDDMYYGADFRLRGSTEKIFLCNQYLFDQYARERKKSTLFTGIPMSYERTEDGITTLNSNGITILPLDSWDRNIATYFQNGTKAHQPHRAVLSTKSNFVLGTEEAGNLEGLDIFYDKKTKYMYIDFQFNLDVKMLEEYMCMYAYGTTTSGS